MSQKKNSSYYANKVVKDVKSTGKKLWLWGERNIARQRDSYRPLLTFAWCIVYALIISYFAVCNIIYRACQYGFALGTQQVSKNV